MRLFQEGSIIRDTYEIETFLGEGAFAEVYRVKHRFLGRQAMKVFKRKGIEVSEVEEMLHEALLLSRIGHPNIIRVFDANVFETNSGIYGYFTMENIPGGSVDKFWRSHGSKLMPVDTVVEISKQVCRGLAVAHGEDPPIIHRDIKPQNVLVGYDGTGIRVRLSDFGLAKRVNPLTFLASARGTPCFKSPECLKDHQMDSTAGDVWALGTMLYLMLTDRLPYPECINIADLNFDCFKNPVESPEKFNARVDRVLSKIVLKCLTTDPRDRYQSAIHILKALEKWSPEMADDLHAMDHRSTHSKDSLGLYSPLDGKKANSMVEDALDMAKKPGNLTDAADLLEQAINMDPLVREKHEHLVKLWRRGIYM